MRQQIISEGAKGYLRALRQIPADIRLSLLTRDIEVGCGTSCVCGWAIREAIARSNPLMSAESADPYDDPDQEDGVFWQTPYHRCEVRFDGVSLEEWRKLYEGADTDTANVEEAFAIAIAEAAEGRKLVRL